MRIFRQSCLGDGCVAEAAEINRVPALAAAEGVAEAVGALRAELLPEAPHRTCKSLRA